MNALAFTARDRVLILAPHPDDESLAAGGLIQRAVAAGARIRVVFATDGDNNPWPQRFVERRLQIRHADRARWGRRRRKEALAALACLGLGKNCARFLAMPDQGATGLLLHADENALFSLWAELTEWRPTVLVLPSGADAHPDHSALFVLMQLALARAEISPRQLRYLVHVPKRHGERGRVALRLRDGEVAAKREAILCHESQMALSQKRFVAFADEREIFFTAPAPAVRHAAVSGTLERGALRLRLRLHGPRANFAGQTLLLALESFTEGSVRWSLPLPAGSRCAQLLDAKTGAPVRLATVRMEGRRHATVCIPVAALQPLRQVFVKLQRRSFLYDQTGWHEIAVAETEEVAPVRSVEAFAA